jgi:2-keto-4-pentenoate hydratase/2-oxohepta-3-ene-1,7-dioic acid hydratase in catechol pathway
MSIPDIPTVFLYVPFSHTHESVFCRFSANHRHFFLQHSKPQTSLADPWPAPTIIPKHTIASDSADYESELAIVIGKEAKNVSESDALDYVLGYTASNDISSRAAQFAQTQWCYSKGFDGACPIGPVLVSKRLVPDASQLRMRGLKNGKVLQESPLTCVSASFSFFPRLGL